MGKTGKHQMRLFQKLSSRKLWVAVAGILTGIAVALGAEQNAVSAVAGAVTAASSVISYILTEGRVDAASAAHAAEKIETAAEKLEEIH